MEHLPPWLRNLPLPPRPPGRGEPDAAVALPAAGSGDEVPDWLRELQSEMDAGGSRSAADAEPDWLHAASSEPEPATASPAEPSARPQPFGATSWLQSLGSSPEPPAEPPPSEPSAEPPTTTSRIRMPVGATDWLRSIGQEGEREEVEPPPPPDEEPQSGVPEWLRDFTPDEVARAVKAEAPDSQPVFDPQAPGWLTEEPAGSDASTVASDWQVASEADETADAQDVPAWLRDAASDDVDEQPRRRDPGSAPDWLSGADDPPNLAADAAMPAWLRNIAEDDRSASSSDAEPAWLRDRAEEAGAPPARPPAPEADDEVPAWLRDTAEDASTPAARPPAPEADDEMPAWLRDTAEDASTPAARPPAPEADDAMPAWLRDTAENSSAPPPAARPPAPEADDAVPAWLRDTAEDASTPAARSPAPEADDAVPDWLRDTAEDASTPAARSPAPEADDAVPDWLRDIEGAAAPLERSARSSEELTPPSQPAAPPSDNLPPWLATEAAEPNATSNISASASDLALPSWLRGVADETPAPLPSRAAEPPAPPRRAVPAAEESGSFLRGTELPSWLRVPEPERPAETAEGQALDWLRRLGGSDQEEAESSVAVPTIPVPQRARYQRSPEQLEAIELLGRLTRAPYPAPIALPTPIPRTRLQRIGLDRLLYLLLVLALLAGLLVPTLSAPFQSATPSAPGAVELAALLEGLGDEDVALVAYEWGAQRSGELRPLEQSVMSRLIASKTKLVLVSTDFQGTLLSFNQRETLRAAGYNIDPNGSEYGGRDYVLLGYRPGGELALRNLARDLRGELRSDFTGQDASQGAVANQTDGTPRINSVQDLGLILVMADQPQDVQAWMEQVHRVADTVPIVFLLPQEAEPLVQPYLRMPNVYHVAGLQGALALSANSPNADQAAIARATGQQSLAVLVFVSLLLLGAIGLALTRARAPRGGSA